MIKIQGQNSASKAQYEGIMAKTSNNTLVSKKSIKKETSRDIEKSFSRSPWLSEYLDSSLMRIKPVSSAIVNKIADELIEWSKSEQQFTLNSFLFQKGIPKKAFYEWIEKYPELKTAHGMFMMKMSDKREVGGLTRKLDPTFAFNSLPMYDPDWREFMQWKSNLKQQEDNQQKIVVEINDLGKRES